MKALGLVGAGRTWCVKTQGHGELSTPTAFQECGHCRIFFPFRLSVLSVRGNKLGNLWMRGGWKGTERVEKGKEQNTLYWGENTTIY